MIYIINAPVHVTTTMIYIKQDMEQKSIIYMVIYEHYIEKKISSFFFFFFLKRIEYQKNKDYTIISKKKKSM